MSNKLHLFQNLLALSAVALIIIVWSTVTYLALNNRKLQSATSQIATYEECVSAGNTILESYPAVCVTKDGKRFVQDINKVNDSVTNNWKTYENKEYGFKFKYPSDWGTGSECNGDQQSNIIIRLGEHLLKYPDSDCGTANIPSTVIFYIQSKPPQLPSNYHISEQKTFSNNDTTINYLEMSSIDRLLGGSEKIYQFFIPLKDKYLVAQTGSYPSQTLREVFDQILSTFNFSE